MSLIPSRTRRRVSGALAATLLLGAGTLAASPAVAATACETIDGAVQVTADCVDETYASPVIDSESDETTPVAHHRIRGHFDGTGIQFTIYLHAEADKGQWEGRFFQFTYPTAFTPEQDTSKASDRAIGFALGSGGYAVQAGNGSISLGYRHSAAAAKFAEQVAAEYYGSDRPIFGYLYGPSGGSYQTIGAAENTVDVWQGFVPMVQAVPQPTSYNFLGRSAAELILADKAAQIQDALLPGGNGDPYAGLDAAESAMLTELHALGVPWSAWEDPDYLLGYDAEFYGAGLDSDEPLAYDPTYVDDFWNTEGYLGTEASPLGERMRSELVEMGDTVGHRWNIANRFYYRYQVPDESSGWVALDQFRDEDGTPSYPQRQVTAPIFSGAVSGNTAFDGSISGKLIAVSNLTDTDALPLHTDWYRQRVEESLGDAVADSYRVYFTENADHQDAPVSGTRATHLVDWYGMVEQALRDVAAWAEDGVAPPASTEYEIVDGQVVVPDAAAERHGIQPTLTLAVDGGKAVTVLAGHPVSFAADVQVPEGAGEVVAVAWDFDGDGEYAAPVAGRAAMPAPEATTVYDEPGTYLAAVQVSTERTGDATAVHALAKNLDRVRVTVVASCDEASGVVGCAIVPGAVSVTGDPVVGRALSAETSGWEPQPVALAYRWFADGEPIAGATSATLALTSSSAGASVHVEVTGSRDGYEPVVVSSVPVRVLAQESGAGGSGESGASDADAGSGSSGAGSLATTGAGSPVVIALLGAASVLAGAVLAVLRRRARVR